MSEEVIYKLEKIEEADRKLIKQFCEQLNFVLETSIDMQEELSKIWYCMLALGAALFFSVIVLSGVI